MTLPTPTTPQAPTPTDKPDKLHYVCPLESLVHEQPQCIRVAGVDLFVIRRHDQVYAMQNRCGHMSAPLHEGDYTDGLIVCGLHGAGFNVETGAVEWTAILPPPISNYLASDNARIRRFGELIDSIETHPVRAYPVTLSGGEVWVALDG